MAKRYHQRQSEEQQDDGYEWGSHRGGGGSPLRNSDGRPISKLGTVINGNTVVDGDKYNGMKSSSTTSGISIREICRPNTSYHAPSHNNSKLFDPAPSTTGTISSHVPITPIRHQQRGHSPHIQSGDSNVNSNSNVTEVLAHNLQKSNRLRVTNLVQEHQQQHQQPPPSHQQHQQPPPHRQHLKKQIDHDHQTQHDHEQHFSHDKLPEHLHHNTHHTPNNTHHDANNENNNKLEIAELRQEIADLTLTTKKQTMLQSIRWGLANLDLIEDCKCIGHEEGEEVTQTTLTVILKAILLDFLKGKTHNIGVRKLLHYKSEHNKGQTEDKYHAVLTESLHLLCGVEPIISRRPNGDSEVFLEVSNY